MAETNLDIVIRAKNEAERQIGEVNNSLKDKFIPTLKAVGIAAAAAGAAIVGFAISSIKQFADVGDELAKMSKRTGISVEELSKLRYIADLSNVSMETLEMAIRRAGMAFVDAEQGSKQASESFQRLGFGIEELKGMQPDELFFAIAQEIGKIPDPVHRSAAAVEFFGKSGTEILPMLGEDMEALAKEAKSLGIIFTEDMAKAAEEWKDANTRLDAALMGVKLVIAKEVIPILMPLAEGIKDNIKAFGDWMQEMGGIDEIKEKVKFAINELITQIDLNTGMITALKVAWENIKLVWDTQIMPALRELWAALKPYQPMLEILAKIIGTILLVAFHALVLVLKTVVIVTLEVLKNIIDAITTALNIVTKAWNWFTDQLAKAITWIDKVIEKLQVLIDLWNRAKALIGGAMSSAVGGIGKVLGFAEGGIVPGPIGAPTFAVVHGGETIIPSGAGAGVGGITVNINGGTYLSEDAGLDMGNKIAEVLKRQLRI